MRSLTNTLPNLLRLPPVLLACWLGAPACVLDDPGDELDADADAPDVIAGDPLSDWRLVSRDNFSTLSGVSAFTSSAELNGTLSSTDTSNDKLQKPTLASNTVVTSDAAADDGHAVAVWTRRATYMVPSGTRTGWTNGRFMMKNDGVAPPVRVRARVRMTASIKAKSAVMWWPSGGGWPWEVDFVETFGGLSKTDFWGSRHHVSQRWHADLDGDGRATEQLVRDLDVDATRYHVYDLVIRPNRMSIAIDGVVRFETTDQRYIPDGPGKFSIGKALTHRRDAGDRTEDAIYVDWLEVYRPR